MALSHRRPGPRAEERFLEFFTANIRNQNTRDAYVRAVARFFAWCEERGLALRRHRAARTSPPTSRSSTVGLADPSVKQHLAAIRMLFDWLVTGQVAATSTRPPRCAAPSTSSRRARRPCSPPTRPGSSSTPSTISTGRPARPGADRRDGLQLRPRVRRRRHAGRGLLSRKGKRWWLRLHEKGGKFHEVPAHHKAEDYLDAYIEAAGIDGRAEEAPASAPPRPHRRAHRAAA